RARAGSAARRLPRGVRPARRRRVRSQRGRPAARHRGRDLEITGVQGAREAACDLAVDITVGSVRWPDRKTMHPNETAIHDYVDETLDAAERAGVERHLASCDECRMLVADLREIRRVAGALELREPPLRAWGRIERAIHLEDEHSAGRAWG